MSFMRVKDSQMKKELGEAVSELQSPRSQCDCDTIKIQILFRLHLSIEHFPSIVQSSVSNALF